MHGAGEVAPAPGAARRPRAHSRPGGPVPAALLALACLLAAPAARPEDAAAPGRFSLHFQATAAIQAHPPMASGRSGPNSLAADGESATSVVMDLLLGARLWSGAELTLQPELSGGSGLSRTTGVAAFPSGEVYRVGDPSPSIYLARLALAQTVALGAGDTLLVQAGRFWVGELFDRVPACDDAHLRFGSWGLWASAAWDYPADVRGFTWGAAADLALGAWSVRAGAFLEPTTANGATLEADPTRSLGLVVEGERRWALAAGRGAVRVLAFLNRAPMGSYAEAAALPAPDVAAVRGPVRSKWGFAASANQEWREGLSLFVRASWNDGATESWAFTEIDRALALGATVRGARWGRPDDEAGLAAVASLLSLDHRRYLEAGGQGFLLGDGGLRYGPELLLELFYRAQLVPGVALVGSVQPIVNPGYDRDRGPTLVFGARLHAAL